MSKQRKNQLLMYHFTERRTHMWSIFWWYIIYICNFSLFLFSFVFFFFFFHSSIYKLASLGILHRNLLSFHFISRLFDATFLPNAFTGDIFTEYYIQLSTTMQATNRKGPNDFQLINLMNFLVTFRHRSFA